LLKLRFIPCLLLKDQGLVKTISFKKDVYIGDPINAVKIFNEKEVDEIIILDIEASKPGRSIQMDHLGEIASECFMPLCYGGGIKTVTEALDILSLGVEKVSINFSAITDPDLITQISEKAGKQSTVVSIDVKRSWRGEYNIFNHVLGKSVGLNPVEYAKKIESLGAGEILLNSVDCDGAMTGYDLTLISHVANSVKIPVIVCGGAGSLSDFSKASQIPGVSAVAAGSLFVFQGKHKAVLINYPPYNTLKEIS
jgi:imidazole glycerol-phosphate synthase subunit HisF